MKILIFAAFLLAGCTSQQGQAVLDQDLGNLLNRCGGEIMFGGPAITGHITCPVPAAPKTP